ncbi:MAG: hypothetical protein U0Y68_21685 [Blastocatellia bacterium]
MFEDTPNFFSHLELSLYRVVFTALEQVLLILLVVSLILLVVTVALTLQTHWRRQRAARADRSQATLIPHRAGKKFSLRLAKF